MAGVFWLGIVLSSGYFCLFTVLASWAPLGSPKCPKSADPILSDSEEALFLTEPNGRVIYDTDAFRALVRSVNGDDLIGSANLGSLAELIAPVSAKIFRELKGQAADGKRDVCYVDISVGEETYHWRVSVEPVGTPEWALSLWTFVDVTAQRQLEARRENDQQFFFDLLDELPVGLFSAAHDGTLQYINKTLASWLSLDGDDSGLAPPLTLSDFIAAGNGRDDVAQVETDKSGMHGGLSLQGRKGEAFSAYLIQSQKENKEGSSNTAVLWYCENPLYRL